MGTAQSDSQSALYWPVGRRGLRSGRPRDWGGRNDGYTQRASPVVCGHASRRSREENPRWTSFRESYRFAPFSCEPGLRGAREKGGVEGQVG
ncbi:hypothetical protein [Streptomyces griseochromogenes]|uniref:hypothetical protein n=1 Tax=Streptomyces griseochromogenes TaxID=68214 RepID=UPI00378EB842